MGEFSITHILLLGIIALIFFGPSRLPALGQSLGKAIKGFKQGLNEIDAEVKPVEDTQQLAARQKTQAQEQAHASPAQDPTQTTKEKQNT